MIYKQEQCMYTLKMAGVERLTLPEWIENFGRENGGRPGWTCVVCENTSMFLLIKRAATPEAVTTTIALRPVEIQTCS